MVVANVWCPRRIKRARSAREDSSIYIYIYDVYIYIYDTYVSHSYASVCQVVAITLFTHVFSLV